ncbi:protein CURVATURE THYLAKOID 1C, chloroplastic [Aristolochia californica]|uniref:protein CURVATURE THYLAKOID 1C, chloroplastic n=1 Tax=Aristolochia californica TaxID=171875 RepID=UPI0035E05114
MAFSISVPSPSLLCHGQKFLSRSLPAFPISIVGQRQKYVTIIAKAVGDSSDSSPSQSIVKSVQNAWDKSEDRIGLVGLSLAAVIALWASTNLITAIDKLPIVPNVFEFIGILFSSWFVYRYLLFKPDREELLKILEKSISDVLGQ